MREMVLFPFSTDQQGEEDERCISKYESEKTLECAANILVE